MVEKTVLGVMSGTSLDGVDLAMLHFERKEVWKYSILATTTLAYPEEWVRRLRHAVDLSKQDLAVLDRDYTLYLAKIIQGF